MANNDDSQNPRVSPLKRLWNRKHFDSPGLSFRDRMGRLFGSDTSSASFVPDDHRGLLVLPEPQGLATPEARNRSDDLSPPQHSAQNASTSQSAESVAKPAILESNSQPTKPTPGSSTKGPLELTGSALLTLAKKAIDIVDDNPVKVALGLVKAVIDIYQQVKDNKDEVARQIALTGGRLKEVEDALRDWKPRNNEGFPWMDHFQSTLKHELHGLGKLEDESGFRKFLDHEDEQEQIKSIFARIDETRIRFELALGIRNFQAVYELDQTVRALFLDHLKPSKIAHHDYNSNGMEEQLLRRHVCAPGTRSRILDGIITWAKDTATNSPQLYWLFGHAGSGKSTIAYTIANRFEFAGDPNDTIILGGDFLCSRQFEETRSSRYIVPTIAYYLALKCKPFADALYRLGKLEAISQNHTTQLETLLLGPWLACKGARVADPSTPSHYLIVIDALDEIDGKGGSDFLQSLVNAINRDGGECLNGLKFFITSRSDPSLVSHVESLKQKQLYRLQDANEGEVRADVAKYLEANLPHFKGRQGFEQLANQAAGLFIYAATIVKLLAGLSPVEQEDILRELSARNDFTSSQSPLQDPDAVLNQLYHRILQEAFGNLRSEHLRRRLIALFTFLCAKEPLTISTAAGLLYMEDPAMTGLMTQKHHIAEYVLKPLHSVLYIENGKVLAYHKSFPDFIFDSTRSGNFSCDRATHHRDLTNYCFQVMKGGNDSQGRFTEGLKFNLANIPSSFVLDKDNHALAKEVEQNISSALSYSCRNWDHHLAFVASTPSDLLFETLSEFMQLRALFWIEAMNLLHSNAHQMLRMAHKWVIDSKGNLKLAKDLKDAASFSLYFSEGKASSSTPHLYISALASWVGRQDICQSWKTHFPGIPKFFNAGMGGILLTDLAMNGSNLTACSDDGGYFASEDGNEIFVTDAFMHYQTRSFYGHTDLVTSLTISKRGHRVVSGSRDKSVRVWHVLGHEDHVLRGHTNSVTAIAISDDETRIVSGAEDNSVRVWDAWHGEELHVLTGHTKGVSSVAISNDATLIASGSNDESVRVWDALKGVELHVLTGHIQGVISLKFSNDRTVIAAVSGDKFIHMWDTSTGNELLVVNGHTSRITSIAVSNDGTRIVSASDSENNPVRVWDWTGKELCVLNGHTSGVESIAISYDGAQIVSCSEDESVRLWDGLTGKELHVWYVNEDKTWSIRATSVAISNDGTRVVSGFNDNSVRVWDTSTGDEVHMLSGHTDCVESVAISSDGTCIASGSKDKSVRLWDASTGDARHVHVLNGHTDRVKSVTISNDGTHVVSGSFDKSVRVWDASTGDNLRVLLGHTACVTSIAISQDGNHIVSGSFDKTIRVWDTLTGKNLHVLNGHTREDLSVAISKDGSRIVSGSDDRTIRVWDMRLYENKEYRYFRERASESDSHPFTGWLLSPDANGNRLFWAPDDKLPDDTNILTIPYSAAAHIDFTHSTLGPDWSHCYSP